MRGARFVGQLVRVEWRDAVGHAAWHSERDARDLPLANVVSIGVLLLASEDRTIVASDRDDQGNVTGITVIPTGWVRKIERLA